jgi:uncharacterized protein YjbI with pentapeptide repeats
MANQQQFRLLTDRVRTWNRWYRQHPHIRPDFRLAVLPGAHLSAAQLPRTDFHHANLRGAFLSQANLRYADLSEADLSFAHLAHADLSHANLSGANLSFADLSSTNLNQTFFKETILTKTRLYQALLRETVFAQVDLSQVIGLETAYYLAPSSIGTDTLSLSGNSLPQRFLQHTNTHKNLLASILEQKQTAFDYATTFLSYASEDYLFARQLYDDLTEAGVWCWFAPISLKAGDSWRTRIDHGIKQCDKLLVILSANALASEWVRYEVQVARQKERKRTTRVIVPLCLDQEISKNPGWAAFLREKRYMPSFKNWRDPRRYHEQFRSLLDALRMAAEQDALALLHRQEGKVRHRGRQRRQRHQRWRCFARLFY